MGTYNFLSQTGSSEDFQFANGVAQKVTKETHASFETYNGKHCIHVVGPQEETEAAQIAALTKTYENVFSEFKANLNVGKGVSVLRLLPISGGIFLDGKAYKSKFPRMTARAVCEAYDNVLGRQGHQPVQANFGVEMRIFDESEFAEFEKAFMSYKDL